MLNVTGQNFRNKNPTLFFFAKDIFDSAVNDTCISETERKYVPKLRHSDYWLEIEAHIFILKLFSGNVYTSDLIIIVVVNDRSIKNLNLCPNFIDIFSEVKIQL